MDIVSPRALGQLPGQFQLFAGTAGAGQRIPPIRRLVRAATRWRWLLLGGVGLGALAGLLITSLMTRQYSSTARLEITRETARVVDIDSVQRDTSIGDQEFYQTQYGLLQTKALAERVARQLGLADNAEVLRMLGREDLIAAGRKDFLDPANRAKRVEIVGKLLLGHVGVAPVRGSRLVDITAVTPDPALSQRIATTWTQHFIDSNLERRFEASD